MEQEYNWKARLKKWEWGIDLETATKEDFTDYLDTELYQYTKGLTIDYNL